MAARRAGYIRRPEKFSKGFWDFLHTKKNKKFFESVNLYAIVVIAVLGLLLIGLLNRESGFLTGRVIGGEDFREEIREVIPEEETYFYPGGTPVVGFETKKFSEDELNYICEELKKKDVGTFGAESLCIIYPQKFDRISICQNLPGEFGALDCENLEVCFSC